jgi:tRNA threonylcarbamoyladenosine biosynthesis protein TsaE
MALLDPFSFEATSGSEEQTMRLGARLGELLPTRLVVALRGELGAGKTAFARGVGEGWGADAVFRSPTFTLIQRHVRPADAAVLYHIDLYRAERPSDLAGIGIADMLESEDAVFLIEWPERAEALIQDDAITIRFRALSETKRQLVFSTASPETWRVLAAFRKAAFGV